MKDLHHLKTESSYVYPRRGGFYTSDVISTIVNLSGSFQKFNFQNGVPIVQSKFLLNDSEQSEKHITRS